jgi:hypothetical protein
MNKGQLFSIDLLFGVIILIFGIGLLISAAEINTYNQKQENNYTELVNKTILATQVITNSIDWDCNFDKTHAAYSINKDKFLATPGNTIKEKANLIDYNIRITIGELPPIYDEIINSKDAIVYELEILTCNNTTDFNMLKNCMSTNSTCYNESIKKEIFKLMVAK